MAIYIQICQFINSCLSIVCIIKKLVCLNAHFSERQDSPLSSKLNCGFLFVCTLGTNGLRQLSLLDETTHLNLRLGWFRWWISSTGEFHDPLWRRHYQTLSDGWARTKKMATCGLKIAKQSTSLRTRKSLFFVVRKCHSAQLQSWALEVFFNFFNNKWFFCIFIKLITYICTSPF